MSEKPTGISMDRRHFIGFGATAVASAAIVLAGWGSKEAFGAPGGSTLTIVHTNDVHSYVDVLPYVKSLVNDLKSAGSDVVLVSAGDDFAGTPFATLSAGQDVATAMNMVGYDMTTIGNHEYMMAAADYQAVVRALSFPVLACNVLPSTYADNPSIKPYEIVTVGGRKVAFIGIAYNQPGAPDILASINNAHAAARLEGATIFVGMSHLGLTDPDLNSRSTYVADNCPWMTAIIDGHSHTVLPSGHMRNGVLIAQTGEYGNNIGVTEIAIDSSGVVTGAVASLIAIKGFESTSGITPDAGVVAFIDSVNQKNSSINEVVFTTTGLLAGDRGSVRTKETSLGNFIADAMRAKTGADIAFTSGASLRSDLGPGDVTRGELQTALLAETELARIDITGAEVLDILEDGLSAYPAEYFLFPHISGLSVAFDEALPVGSRVVYAALSNGDLLDPAATYSIAVREDIVGAYLPGVSAPVDGIDYSTGFGRQSDAAIEYARSGIVLDGKIDRRLRVRGVGYTIEFDGGGAASGSMSQISAAYDAEVTLPALGFAYPGATFRGWLDNLGAMHADTEKSLNFDPAALGAVTLVAQWDALVPVLAIDKIDCEPGGTVIVSGADFEPDLDVVLTLNSTPVQVGTVKAGADGAFTDSFVVPRTTPLGAHTLIADNGIHQASIPLAIIALGTGGDDNPDKESSKPKPLADMGDATFLYAAAGAVAASSVAAAIIAAKQSVPETETE